MSSTTTGYGIELVKDVKVVIPIKGVMKVRLNIPTILSRSTEYSNEDVDIKNFFDVENGSIAISQAKCTTHHINIALSAKQKRFTRTFLDAITILQQAADVLNYLSH